MREKGEADDKNILCNILPGLSDIRKCLDYVVCRDVAYAVRGNIPWMGRVAYSVDNQLADDAVRYPCARTRINFREKVFRRGVEMNNRLKSKRSPRFLDGAVLVAALVLTALYVLALSYIG